MLLHGAAPVSRSRTARAWTSPMKLSPVIPERSPEVALRRAPALTHRRCPRGWGRCLI